MDYCLKKEYVLEIPAVISDESFPELNLNFEYPSTITNISVEIAKDSALNPEIIKEILLGTKCSNIQMVIDKNCTATLIEDYLKIISGIGIRSIELILPFDKNYDYELLVEMYKNISFIFIYSAPSAKFIKHHYFGLQQIFASEKEFKITHKKSLDFFNVNLTLFTESQRHNTYFNRKLHISSKGDLKNSPLDATIYGNIKDLNKGLDVVNVINTSQFQKYWDVHKGLVDVCKECEFRHMCVDNRMPVRRNEKEWFMETECNYNPYITKWSDEDNYKTLSECGVVSDSKEFTINRKKIIAINKELWGND